MKILISPYSQRLKNDKDNPKNYPYWNEVVDGLKDKFHITQVGISYETKLNNVHEFKKDLNFKELENLVKSSHLWLSVDNFFPHFCNTIGSKGIVIFSKSDPNIFGYPENLNLLKNRSYLRPDQFGLWDSCEYDIDAFMNPSVIINIVNKMFNDKMTYQNSLSST